MKIMDIIFFLVVGLVGIILVSADGMVPREFLESPCPQIFQYRYDHNGLLHGAIEIYSPNDNIVRLNVELSVGNNVEHYNGNIELAFPKNQVIDDILHRRPIQYRVFFPLWNNIPPKITKILVNSDLICTGPKLRIGGMVAILTTINLQHTLTINGISLSSKKMSTSVPKNHPINFNPQPPKDPVKMYAKNPFLNGFFATSSTTKNPQQSTTQSNMAVTPSSVSPTQTDGAVSNVELSNNPFFNGGLTTNKPILNNNNNNNSKPNKVDLPSREGVKNKNYLYPDVCGFPVITTPLIVNGNPVPRGAYPWLAALFEVKNTGLTYKCSGSLISKRHVVTAAHCVKVRNRKVRPEEILLVLGKLNIKKWTANDGELNVDAETIHVHPDYEAMSAHADIAIVVLIEDIQFTKFIRPICLWNGPDDLDRVVGVKGTVVGWGKNEYGEIMTAEPKETALPIVSQEQCLRSSDTFQFITSEKTFCAGYRNGSGPCNGDSGSGFIMRANNGRWVLRGVVSMSLSDVNSRSCDLSNYVVFTDASKYVNWLLSFIE